MLSDVSESRDGRGSLIRGREGHGTILIPAGERKKGADPGRPIATSLAKKRKKKITGLLGAFLLSSTEGGGGSPLLQEREKNTLEVTSINYIEGDSFTFFNREGEDRENLEVQQQVQNDRFHFL